LAIAYIDGLWTRRIGSYFLPDSLHFEYGYADFKEWKDQIERYVADTREYWLRHYTPTEGDVIVDVGAGRGEDTLTFSRGVGAKGRVVAIEAHPLSFAILKNFCKLNRLTNVTALHIALMDKPGSVRIIESASSWMEHTVHRNGTANGVEVPARTLDQICMQLGLGEIAFLKMNIEGAERYALLGMEKTMPRIRQICVACHDFRAEQGHGEQFRTRKFAELFLGSHRFTPVSRTDHACDYVRDHIFGLRSPQSPPARQ
jgi:FkbM family methyltransferase